MSQEQEPSRRTLEACLKELHLKTMRQECEGVARQAQQESWSYQDFLRELAERDDISINQFIATAVAEKAAALLTVQYLEARGQRADTKLVDRVLSRVPDVPPIEGDEVIPRVPKRKRRAPRRG